MNLNPLTVCRPALPQDTPRVLELTRTIWGGHDYLPYVWDDWLADPRGLLIVTEYGGQVAGTGRLTRCTAQDWWLEGLRVDPQYQSRGIAVHIFDYLMQRWRQLGGGSVRLMTTTDRPKVHHMCARFGFECVSNQMFYMGSRLDEPSAAFTPLAAAEAPQALALCQASPTLPLSKGLGMLVWRMSLPDVGQLAEAAQAGRAWWWRDGQGLLVTWQDQDDDERYQIIQWVAASLEALPELLADFRRLAAAQGCQAAGWQAPLVPEALAALQVAGFQPEPDGDEMLIFAFSS
jgi:GNAT superfamily N-acetyltransferase